MEVHTFTFNPFLENTYVVYQNGNAIVVDPGMHNSREVRQFDDFLQQKNLTLKAIINTHCHIDHILGINAVLDKYQVPFYAHSLERMNWQNAENQAMMFGLPFKDKVAEPDVLLDDMDECQIAGMNFKVLFVPGHSPGHVAFYAEEHQLLLSGDVLFRESVGRTDLPGGDAPTLLKSIVATLYALPNEVKVLPGHMEDTSIGHEKQHNPFTQ